jgi:uridine kinase
MAQHVSLLKTGQPVQVPQYNFSTHRRLEKTMDFVHTPFLIVEGILILSSEKLREQIDVSFFLDIPEEIRFLRRLNRDVRERGRDAEGVRLQYKNQVKPMYDQFVYPSRLFATHVIQNPFHNWLSHMVKYDK